MSSSHPGSPDTSGRDSQAHLPTNLVGMNFLNLPQAPNDNPYSPVLQAVKANPKEWSEFVITAKYNFNLLNRHCLELYTQVNKLKDAIEQYQIYQETLTVSNKDLKQQHQGQKVIVTYLQTHNGSRQSRHSAAISDPDKFNGTNWSYLQEFVYMMQNKLRGNANWYSAGNNLEGTCVAQLNYIYSWTFEVCIKQLLTHLRAENSLQGDITTDEEVFEFIKHIFDNLNCVGTAQWVLANLHQIKHLYLKYRSEFQQYMNDTGYNKIALKSAFQLGLSVKIHDKLINMTGVNTLTLSQLMNECQRLNNKLCQLGTDLFYKCVFDTSSLFILNTNAAKSHPPPAIFAVISTSINTFRDPMNLSDVNTRCLKTDAEWAAQRTHCMINELCLYCDSDQHQICSCNAKPSGSPHSGIQLWAVTVILSTSAAPATPEAPQDWAENA